MGGTIPKIHGTGKKEQVAAIPRKQLEYLESNSRGRNGSRQKKLLTPHPWSCGCLILIGLPRDRVDSPPLGNGF